MKSDDIDRMIEEMSEKHIHKLDKKWVGLTDEEIYDIRKEFTYNDEDFNEEVGFGKAVEAKLKEKNYK